MTETQKTIAAYRAEQQRRQKIGDIFAAAFVLVLSVPTISAIAYALIA
jgi:lipopolysaccharide/colanic/teichoic acid biosynthesis glycosyltransferase